MLFESSLLSRLRKARQMVVLTGAGVSAESGIPTFRDAQTGLWAQYDAQALATPQAFRHNPRLVWEWYAWRRALVEQCQPNPAHMALARLATIVPQLTLITQNIDGLHQRAGSHDVIELHGNLFRYKCVPRQHYTAELPAGDELPPRCAECGGLLRPDVVWFGENLDPARLRAASVAAERADVLLTIGTSSVVYPAAQLPVLALQHGAYVIEINPTPTPLTPHVQMTFAAPAGELLPQLLTVAWPDAA